MLLQPSTSSLIMALSTGLFAPLPAPQGSIQRELRVMGTVLHVQVEAETRALALEASEAALEAIEAAESRLSTWRPDSELSRLSRAPIGEPQPLSPALGRALQRAYHWSQQTGGAFDPSLAPLIRSWDLRGEGRRPTPAELRAALGHCGLEHFQQELPGSITRLSPGAGFEEGGFGKGAALDEAQLALTTLGVRSAHLDLGGQVLVLPRKEAFLLEIAHPDDREHGVLQLALKSGSIATSGNSERGLVIAGERLGHLLDPRSGKPAADFGSVTVWCERAIDADCLSTALYVLGPVEGLAFAESQEGVEAVFLLRNEGTPIAHATSGLRSTLSSLHTGLLIEWAPTPPSPPAASGRTSPPR